MMEANFNDKQLLIMDKALEIFSEKGYNGSSVRDIAHRTGVNVAMISYYFGSKDKLLEAIFVRHAANIQQKLESIIHNEELDPIEKISNIMDTTISIMVKRKEFNKVMMRESVLFKEGGSLFNIVVEMKRQNRALISEAVTEGINKGLFRKDIDIDFLVMIMMGGLYYLISNEHFSHCKALSLKQSGFHEPSIESFSSQLKLMFKAYLTYEVS